MLFTWCYYFSSQRKKKKGGGWIFLILNIWTTILKNTILPCQDNIFQAAKQPKDFMQQLPLTTALRFLLLSSHVRVYKTYKTNKPTPYSSIASTALQSLSWGYNLLSLRICPLSHVESTHLLHKCQLHSSTMQALVKGEIKEGSMCTVSPCIQDTHAIPRKMQQRLCAHQLYY